ncbi:MAG: hypothetical protein J5I50_04715 [Chitinophagaceae bacterium]|nr:hypothetical protein [Chitinophagaceae bacterium]
MKVLSALNSLYRYTLPVFLMLLIASCGKEYSLENVDTSLAAGTWQFKEGASEYMGNIDTAYIRSGLSTDEMHLIGTSMDGSQTFHLTLYADEFQPGTYKTSNFQSAFSYFSGRLDIYEAAQVFGEFTVTITSVNKNTITGIFSGKASADGQTIVDIFSGSFSAVFAGPVLKPKSEGTLTTEAGECMPATINGQYKQGIPLNASNTVGVQAAVAEPGTYSIFTDKVNGVIYSATGEFTANGVQTVNLKGSGIPEEGGEFTFTVHYGNSMCAFKITFEAGAAPSKDYFPTSNRSNWKYTDGTSDYTLQVATSTVTIAGKTYSVIMQGSDTAFTVRKASGNYYDFMNYGEIFGLTNSLSLETIFLKDNVATGATWNGPNFTNPQLGGATLNIRYQILEKGVVASAGPFTFPDVIKVKADLYSGGVFFMALSEAWYAKNVGLILYTDAVNNETVTIKEFNIY